MSIELFILGGYGQFIWSAFIFTFLSCLILYLKTKKEFLKQEKKFLEEFKTIESRKIKIIKEKEAVKENLSSSSIF